MEIDGKKISNEHIILIRRDWEKRFPDFIGDWTHYLIKGDNIELGVVDGLKLIEAIDLVEENFGKYKIILVHLAKLDSNAQCIYEINNHFISTYISDKITIINYKYYKTFGY